MRRHRPDKLPPIRLVAVGTYAKPAYVPYPGHVERWVSVWRLLRV
jgi:hypothetical protein